MPLNNKQQQAFEMVKTYPISLLSGAPGTGKTFTLKTIIPWAESEGYDIACAAPTGKAAHQISKATERPASTIHRLLEAMYDERKGKFFFKRDRNNPLKATFLIIDECSMVDLSLMASVMDAVDLSRTKLLLIGDAFQLPSVSPGAVLRDLIDSEIIPHVELTEVQRNSGDIVKACHDIKDGKYYTPSAKIELPELNLRHLSITSPNLIQKKIEDLVCGWAPYMGYDPVKDVQVLSPVNSRGELSCDKLNALLQDRLNPNQKVEKTIFRLGSKVIYTKNSRVSSTEGKETMVLNGDMGYVIDMPKDRRQMILRFENPRRDVVIPLSTKDVKLAYCVTCHRMQGSESPVVIIPFHTSFGYFVTRQWIYTAISRAQKICITVGQESAIKQAIDNNTIGNRKTMLSEKLKNEKR